GPRLELAIIADTGLNCRTRNKAFNVGTKFGKIFGTIAHRVALKLAIDLSLRQQRIEGTARAKRHPNAWRTTWAVVFLERVIELAVHGIRRADHHEWAACCQQAGTNGSENLNIRIGEVGRGEPESHLIRYDRDIGSTAQRLEIARPHFDADAISQF